MTTAGGGDDEDFDELAAFRRDERARHARLVLVVAGGSLAFVLSGLFALSMARQSGSVPVFGVGAMLLGLGVLGLVRAAVSWWTDIDTRDRRPFDVDDDDARAGGG